MRVKYPITWVGYTVNNTTKVSNRWYVLDQQTTRFGHIEAIIRFVQNEL